MYLHHRCDEKSLYFVDFLINAIKILDAGNMDLRMGPTLKFFQTVFVCTEICHG